MTVTTWGGGGGGGISPKYIHAEDPANMTRWPSVAVMSVHHLRRWPTITTTLGQRVMFAGEEGTHNSDNITWIGKQYHARDDMYCGSVHISLER